MVLLFFFVSFCTYGPFEVPFPFFTNGMDRFTGRSLWYEGKREAARRKTKRRIAKPKAQRKGTLSS